MVLEANRPDPMRFYAGTATWICPGCGKDVIVGSGSVIDMDNFGQYRCYNCKCIFEGIHVIERSPQK